MDNSQQQLIAYISAQLQNGQTPDDIAAQLDQAGWPADRIHQAFQTVQAQVMPKHLQAPPKAAHETAAADAHTAHLSSASHDTAAGPVEIPQALGQRRGRLKIGWALVKNSVTILNGNRYLLRYFGMTWVLVIAINAAIVGLLLAVSPEFFDSIVRWFGLLAFSYLVIYVVVNFYAASLAANIMDIYKGQRQPYSHYIKMARGKFGPIFVYSLIAAVIGVILEYVVERLGRIGQIISWLIGTAWSISTMFVLPIIMDTPSSAPAAIKESFGMLKKTWGEGITAKVTINAPLFIIQFLLAIPFYWIIFAAVEAQSFGLTIIVLIIYVFISLSIAVLGSFANSLINVALYYFAVNHQVPPGFDAEMLNKVFVKKSTTKGFFKRT